MPEQFALHVTHALALDGIRNDHRGSVTTLFKGIDGLTDRFEVMTIDLQDIPIEGLEFLRQGGEVTDVLHITQTLDLIVINNQTEMAQVLMGCKEDGLPTGALVQLPIAREHIGIVILMLHLATHCDATGHRKTMTQAT